MQNVVFCNRCFLQVSLIGGSREEKSMNLWDEVLRWAHRGSRNATLEGCIWGLERHEKAGLSLWGPEVNLSNLSASPSDLAAGISWNKGEHL